MKKQFITLAGRRGAWKLAALVAAMFVGALLETLGISMIGVVCTLLIDSDVLAGNKFLGALARFTGQSDGTQFIFSLLGFLICVYLFKMLYLLIENYAMSKFVYSLQHDISVELYDGILHSPYSYFTRMSTAEVINLLGSDLTRMANFLTAFLQTVTEGLVMAVVSIFLMVQNATMTLFVMAGLATAFFLSVFTTRLRLYRSGDALKRANTKRLKWRHQGIYGIKEIKVARTEDYFCARHREADLEVSVSACKNQFLVKMPAQITEAVLAVSVICYILFLVRGRQDVISYLPSLSALVMAAIRLLPSCSRINSGLAQMNGTRPSLEAIVKALERVRGQEAVSAQAEEQQVTELARGIEARGVTFRYEGRSEPVLENVDVEIPIGTSVGIVGQSGAGKTTLVDILLGLLEPQQGAVYADGIDIRTCMDSYLAHIAYIPQNIFLLDDTVRSNVAFGVPREQVDDDAVWGALEKAALAGLVRKLANGLDALVGENGIRLSGGERQRLGIARALYRGCGVMVFDEATSALDPETEEAILRSIDRLRGERTMIVISHRRSAVAGCDRLYRVEGSHVLQVTESGQEGENI